MSYFEYCKNIKEIRRNGWKSEQKPLAISSSQSSWSRHNKYLTHTHMHTCTHLYWRTHTPFAGSLTLLCEKLLGKVHMSGKCCCCCCCFCSGKTFTRLIFLSNLKCTRCCSSSSSRKRRVACSARCSATHGGSSSLRCPKHTRTLAHTHDHTRNWCSSKTVRHVRNSQRVSQRKRLNQRQRERERKGVSERDR